MIHLFQVNAGVWSLRQGEGQGCGKLWVLGQFGRCGFTIWEVMAGSANGRQLRPPLPPPHEPEKRKWGAGSLGQDRSPVPPHPRPLPEGEGEAQPGRWEKVQGGVKMTGSDGLQCKDPENKAFFRSLRSSRLCVLRPAAANPKRNLPWPEGAHDSPKLFGRADSTQRREERREKRRTRGARGAWLELFPVESDDGV
jgi:hypothetical protein